jgi:hypothetical protein
VGSSGTGSSVWKRITNDKKTGAHGRSLTEQAGYGTEHGVTQHRRLGAQVGMLVKTL